MKTLNIRSGTGTSTVLRELRNTPEHVLVRPTAMIEHRRPSSQWNGDPMTQ